MTKHYHRASDLPLTEAELISDGFSRFTAEAIADIGLSAPQLRSRTGEALLIDVMHWHGILGYTGSLLTAIAEIGDFVDFSDPSSPHVNEVRLNAVYSGKSE
jgi:hypothetical protein